MEDYYVVIEMLIEQAELPSNITKKLVKKNPYGKTLRKILYCIYNDENNKGVGLDKLLKCVGFKYEKVVSGAISYLTRIGLISTEYSQGSKYRKYSLTHTGMSVCDILKNNYF